MRERPEKPIFGSEPAGHDPRAAPIVTVRRSIAKTISWRTLGTLDTLILSFLLITYLGPLFGLRESEGSALETAGLIAITEVATKMTFYFLHERAWAAMKAGVYLHGGRRRERIGRTAAKTASWRFIASVDTIILAWFYTGNLATAVSIGGMEVLTKLLLYFIHERIWAKIPFGIEGPSSSDGHTVTIDN